MKSTLPLPVFAHMTGRFFNLTIRQERMRACLLIASPLLIGTIKRTPGARLVGMK